ncbi:MAG: energy transducer TonB [Breznakibacter sp.]
MKHVLIICFYLLFCQLAAAQLVALRDLVTINRPVGHFLHSYQALASDTSVKHGGYELLYKNKTLERGCYRQNNRVGVWQFYNLKNALEFTYDYNNGKVDKFVRPSDGDYDTPCFFLGSPLIPYLFMLSRLHYPEVEMENRSNQEVMLALRISTEGRMTGVRLLKNARAGFDESVMKAASSIPNHWQWLPARKDGAAVESDYLIKIVFEPVE